MVPLVANGTIGNQRTLNVSWQPMVPLVPMLPLVESLVPTVPLVVPITACVHCSTNGIPVSFKVLPMVPLVIPLVPIVPLVKTDGSQCYRQSTVWAKLPTLESHMIQYGIVMNMHFIIILGQPFFFI